MAVPHRSPPKPQLPLIYSQEVQRHICPLRKYVLLQSSYCSPRDWQCRGQSFLLLVHSKDNVLLQSSLCSNGGRTDDDDDDDDDHDVMPIGRCAEQGVESVHVPGVDCCELTSSEEGGLNLRLTRLRVAPPPLACRKPSRRCDGARPPRLTTPPRELVGCPANVRASPPPARGRHS